MTTTPVDRLVAPGDVVLIEFGPVRGTQQDGRRPGLVVSVDEMHDITRRAIVCPSTRNVDPWPTKVVLPPSSVVRGAGLTDQVRSIDRQARILRRLGSVPEAVLADVRQQLALALGLRTERHRFRLIGSVRCLPVLARRSRSEPGLCPIRKRRAAGSLRLRLR